jgi:hypothetical protein
MLFPNFFKAHTAKRHGKSTPAMKRLGEASVASPIVGKN